jgi:cytochrome oxidase Cu insertion factor (SCO1/SenC/PrrC family)
VTALERSTPETELGAYIESLRDLPQGPDELAALLPENLPIYQGRSAAEMGRLRGYLLAAFADTGLPDAALLYVLESLETGHIAYEVAGAAIGLRGLQTPSVDVAAPLLRAIDNLSGADATVSFETYNPAWPYAEPTTALTEVVRTIGQLGARAEAALEELGRLAQQQERFSRSVLEEMQRVLDKASAGHGEPACHAGCDGEACKCALAVELASDHPCCADMTLPEPVQDHATTGAMLQDQDGRTERLEDFFRGKPSVVAFFYTRCDNPYKCSLTITKFAALQASLEERGLADALRVAAITYDPEFDLPHRLRRYGTDRGMRFSEDTRFFRVTSGFQEIQRRFNLGVNYGASTVNRHQIEVYVLNREGGIAASFTRMPWEIEAVLRAAGNLLSPRQANGVIMRRRHSESSGDQRSVLTVVC